MIASNAAAPYTWCCPTGGTGATVVCLKTTTKSINSTRVVVVVKVVGIILVTAVAFRMAAVASQTWFDAAAHCAMGRFGVGMQSACWDFLALGCKVHVAVN